MNGWYHRKRHGTRAHQQPSTHFPAALRFPLRSSAKAKENYQSSSSSGHLLQASVRRLATWGQHHTLQRVRTLLGSACFLPRWGRRGAKRASRASEPCWGRAGKLRILYRLPCQPLGFCRAGRWRQGQTEGVERRILLAGGSHVNTGNEFFF